MEDISNGALINFGNSNLEEMIRKRKRCMINEKLAKQTEQHKKRWKEHPEECPAEINSMSEEEVYDGIRSCTFLDTEIPGEAREKFVKRLKKEKKRKINRKK